MAVHTAVDSTRIMYGTESEAQGREWDVFECYECCRTYRGNEVKKN